MSDANPDIEHIETNTNEDEPVVEGHDEDDQTGEPDPSANIASECLKPDCHTAFLPGHKLCFIHSPCIKDDSYVITDCLTCARALNKIKFETYDSAAKTSHWRFILHTFWTIQARRDRASLALPLLWNRDEYPLLFPQSLLEGSGRTEFRNDFFPELDTDQDQEFDYDEINASFASHLLRCRVPIVQDPLNRVPARPLSTASVHFVNIPPSWKVTVENGELIATQPTISPSGVQTSS